MKAWDQKTVAQASSPTSRPSTRWTEQHSLKGDDMNISGKGRRLLQGWHTWTELALSNSLKPGWVATPPFLCHRKPQAMKGQAECSPALLEQSGIRKANDKAGRFSSPPLVVAPLPEPSVSVSF